MILRDETEDAAEGVEDVAEDADDDHHDVRAILLGVVVKGLLGTAVPVPSTSDIAPAKAMKRTPMIKSKVQRTISMMLKTFPTVYMALEAFFIFFLLQKVVQIYAKQSGKSINYLSFSV